MTEHNPINIRLIDHVVLRVHDLERMIAFYSDVLGCQLERGPEETGLAQLRAGLSLIDLVAAKSPVGRQADGLPDHSAANMDHVCLQVDTWNDDAILEHLKRHGVAFDGIGIRYGAQGLGPSLYLRDPENNTVELKGKG